VDGVVLKREKSFIGFDGRERERDGDGGGGELVLFFVFSFVFSFLFLDYKKEQMLLPSSLCNTNELE
jgi:hypothetical protein